MGSRLRALRSLSILARLPLQDITPRRAMTSKTSHEERTAADRREPGLHTVVLDKIEQVNMNIRLLKLGPRGEKPKFLPGQWLDVHVPRIPQAGGFTITSTPDDLKKDEPYLELAVQHSPNNPPAAWLWQREKKILGTELQIRVGGSFVWPPPGIDTNQVHKVVLVAGGVGINPLLSIITHLILHSDYHGQIELLYTSRKGPSGNISSILFVKRIHELFQRDLPQKRHHYTLFCTAPFALPSTSHSGEKRSNVIRERSGDMHYVGEHQSIEYRRFEQKDLETALGPVEERGNTVAYVCGPPRMTDWAVDVLNRSKGMDQARVLCEKWW
ncbi:hypothetical protein HO173_001199 [Letharia columbiana]|uniref:FAD-binding FR-type domain-containing protein n=1 Tax=Letharia columbiana TaxID=112416 RepID=A0A8H6L9J6_9LECA|nr:uncharacterized protein HO173_001199 [Letharia columbiana]KAF6240531.1 hypothetical protein HO173_001199 [Letharia columbiana]